MFCVLCFFFVVGNIILKSFTFTDLLSILFCLLLLMFISLPPAFVFFLFTGLAVLDGVEQIHPATLSSLQRLVNDREVTLSSGRRFMSFQRCIGLLRRLASLRNDLDAGQAEEWSKPTQERILWLRETHGVYAIHPSASVSLCHFFYFFYFFWIWKLA